MLCAACALRFVRSLEQGDLHDLEGVPVRVHDQCLTSEVLGSLRCDCKQQLELALDYIIEHGGCIIYMQQVGGSSLRQILGRLFRSRSIALGFLFVRYALCDCSILSTLGT